MVWSPDLGLANVFQSIGLTLAPRTATRICPGPACGSGASVHSRTSGPRAAPRVYQGRSTVRTVVFPWIDNDVHGGTVGVLDRPRRHLHRRGGPPGRRRPAHSQAAVGEPDP